MQIKNNDRPTVICHILMSLDGKISGASPISIRAARVEDRKAPPLDRRGRPLLKPIRPVNIQDEPAYRGMLIMGYHNSLTALTSLDLPVLARRCKGHENL